MPRSCEGEISVARTHVGEIFSPRQKIVTPITHTITKILSNKGIANIDTEAMRHLIIIGVKCEVIAENLFKIIKSEIIPLSITEAPPEINYARWTILISDKLNFLPL